MLCHLTGDGVSPWTPPGYDLGFVRLTGDGVHVPSGPRRDTIDPGFVRFRSRSDRTEIVIKKY